jgi:CheY-like chemotaxis protein
MQTVEGERHAQGEATRVLLVEIHDELRALLVELLTREGLDVVPVESPAAARATLARGVMVDVVLVDEDTAPYEVMRQARDAPPSPLPVVVGTYGPRHFPGADAEAQKAKLTELVAAVRRASAHADDEQHSSL